MDAERRLLQHVLAAIAYRTQKAIRGAPPQYPEFRAGPGVRTPHALLWHMTSVLGYARTFFVGGEWRPAPEERFEDEVSRFHAVLADLNRLIGERSFGETSARRLLQGPLADAMTHAGQLAILRRLAGSPIPPENFIEADIDSANVGPDQPPPVSPDERWYDAEDEPTRP